MANPVVSRLTDIMGTLMIAWTVSHYAAILRIGDLGC